MLTTTQKSAVLTKPLTLPSWHLLVAGGVYQLGMPFNVALPRRGFRSLRGFVISDQPFMTDVLHYTPRGGFYVTRQVAILDAVIGAYVTVIQDVPFLGYSWGFQVTNTSANPMTALDYHLELVP